MKKNILIIEDDFDIRENIKILLELENYSVVSASNGERGIEIAKQECPDLIICDIKMPGMDGFDVFSSLSNDKKFQMTPFIFLTAKADRENFRKGMELGADDYITKPFSADELLKSVDTRLKKYELFNSFAGKNHSLPHEHSPDNKILIRVGSHSVMIKLDEIIFITADRQYSKIYVKDDRHFVIKKSLKDWEKILPGNLFARIHRSAIINLGFIVKVERVEKNKYRVYLKCADNPMNISRRYYKFFKHMH